MKKRIALMSMLISIFAISSLSSYASSAGTNPLEEIKNYIIYYNEVTTANVGKLGGYDLAILKPSNTTLALNDQIKDKNTLIFGYLSVAEIKSQDDVLINLIKTRIVDKGFNGVFLDTTSYIDYTGQDSATAIEQFNGYMALLKKINSTYPKLLIIQNEGFSSYKKGSSYLVDGLLYDDLRYKTYSDDDQYRTLVNRLSVVSNETNSVVLGVAKQDSKQNYTLSNQLNWLYYNSGQDDDYLNVAKSKYDKKLIEKYDIDFSKSSKGYVRVLFNNDTNKKFKLVVTNKTSGSNYYYNLYSSHLYTNFPLQLGNGTYEVAIYENTSGTKYRSLYKKNGRVNIKNENDIFLGSVQEVSWADEVETINLYNTILAATVAKKGSPLTDTEKVEVAYNYIIGNYKYDYGKISTLSYNYLPFENYFNYEKKGICYDYSALLATMLRSQNIPTKLIKGYATGTDVYHAWNEVYLKEKNEWVIIDTTFDAYKKQNNVAFDMYKSRSDYRKVKEY